MVLTDPVRTIHSSTGIINRGVFDPRNTLS